MSNIKRGCVLLFVAIGSFIWCEEDSSHYQLGIEHYEKKRWEEADREFSLAEEQDEAAAKRLMIAQKLMKGERVNWMGKRSLPRWGCGEDLALNILKEVAILYPFHPLGGEACLMQIHILYEKGEEREAVSLCRQLLNQFPGTGFSIEAYLILAEIYSKTEDPLLHQGDPLTTLKEHIEAFSRAHPSDPGLEGSEEFLISLEERLAAEMWRIRSFYHRRHAEEAVSFYDREICRVFPRTDIARSLTG
ncbi:MAG: hypothetical protein VXZ72_01475 [Chlamydiota bacterium]|nr:hypothetical protein [Chlamydiota bacterium]